jgi:exosortase B
MSAVLRPPDRPSGDNAWTLLPLAIGLAAMYLPSQLDLARKFWTRDDEAHGPIILAIIVWLLWRERARFVRGATRGEQIVGWALFVFGLACYIVGRSQEFFQFDIGSLIPVMLGLGLALGGRAALRRLWFPAFFILFLIPVPPSLVDQILVPLKVTVSQVVTDGLYWLGYPISRSGVVLIIGQYQLLIANACSGLRSMLALSGIGVLYVYVAGHPARLLNIALLCAAIPIAFLANVIRVAALVLITYYFGDEAGASFHDIAGYVEIVLAFGAFFALDALLSRLIAGKHHPTPA